MVTKTQAWQGIEERRQAVWRRGSPKVARFISTELSAGAAGSLIVTFQHRCVEGAPQEDTYRLAPRWNAVRLAREPEAKGYWVYPYCDRCQVWVSREAIERHVVLWRLAGGRWEEA